MKEFRIVSLSWRFREISADGEMTVESARSPIALLNSL